MRRRTWNDLTSTEQEKILRLYYGVSLDDLPFAGEVPVAKIIEEFDLDARSQSFGDFLPGYDAGALCEMCQAPVALRAISQAEWRRLRRPGGRTEAARAVDVAEWIPPGLTVSIPYRFGRARTCVKCQHRTESGGCPCARCKARYRREHRERVEGCETATGERERAQQLQLADARRLASAKRRELETLAAALPRTPLPAEIQRTAAALIAACGDVRDDGGLWLVLGDDDDLPRRYLDPWSGQAVDAWTTLAHLQIRGLVRRAWPGTYQDPEGQGWPIPVERFLLTCSVAEAVELRLVHGPLAVEWERALKKA